MTSQVAQYVGVAATANLRDIQFIRQMLDQVGWPTRVMFMNGPLISRKTLRGLQPDNPAQYPSTNQVAELLIDDPRFFNVIHFNSRDPRLFGQMEQIAKLSLHIHGVQLNVLWPNRFELVKFRQHYPGIRIILQISRFTLESVGYEKVDLIECFEQYAGLVDYGLFDPSGGEGKPYDRNRAKELLASLVESGLPIHWGVTGGLCADRVWGLRELLELYPGLCWDAQSNLRTKDENDQLDPERCFGFLSASAALLR